MAVVETIVSVIVNGLAAGYLAYTFAGGSGAEPEWWKRFVTWWTLRTPKSWDGKPFGCCVCLSFWLSLMFMTWAWAIGGFSALPPTWLIQVFSAAGVSLLLVHALGATRR